MLSLPHFYLGEARYREAVKGMKPDAKKHSMFVGLEPVGTNYLIECLECTVYFICLRKSF